MVESVRDAPRKPESGTLTVSDVLSVLTKLAGDTPVTVNGRKDFRFDVTLQRIEGRKEPLPRLNLLTK